MLHRASPSATLNKILNLYNYIIFTKISQFKYLANHYYEKLNHYSITEYTMVGHFLKGGLMSYLNYYPESTYISSFKEYSNYYYKKTLLVGNSTCNNGSYITILKFPNINDLNEANIVNVSLNMYLLNECNITAGEFRKNLKLCKIIENFNIEEVSWINTPKAVSINLSDCNYSYDRNTNLVSFDISQIFKNIANENDLVYGIALTCRPTFKEAIYRFSSANSCNKPYISINYDRCCSLSIKKLINIFKEQEFTVKSNINEFYSEPLNIHNFNNATYFIKNLGSSTVCAYLQISPDGINFTNDVVESCIKSGESIALSLGKFLKFSRIKFINQTNNTSSNLQVWFQGQTYDYYIK